MVEKRTVIVSGPPLHLGHVTCAMCHLLGKPHPQNGCPMQDAPLRPIDPAVKSAPYRGKRS